MHAPQPTVVLYNSVKFPASHPGIPTTHYVQCLNRRSCSVQQKRFAEDPKRRLCPVGHA